MRPRCQEFAEMQPLASRMLPDTPSSEIVEANAPARIGVAQLNFSPTNSISFLSLIFCEVLSVVTVFLNCGVSAR